MTSKEMESRSGVPRANIRYYEAEGLLTPVRAKNGYREYSEEDLAVLEKIKLLRRLGVSIEELKDLCAGRAELGSVLAHRVEQLQGERELLSRVEQVCGELRASGETFATMNAGKYLKALDEEQASPQLPKADELPVVCSVPRRLFARLFDEFCLTMVVFALVALFGINPSRLEGTGLTLGLQLVIVFLEPLVISLTGTTPGKALLGLHLRGANGEKLSYDEAFTRHWMMLWYGLGLGIPIWSLIQMYRTVNRCADGEPQPWDANIAYIAAPYSWKHTTAFLGAVAVLLGGTEAVNSACQLPPNRGDLTVAEFAENYNRQANYLGLNASTYLDEAGQWQEYPREDGTSITIGDAFDWESLDDAKTFHYMVEDGRITAITMEAEMKNNFDWLTPPVSTAAELIPTFVWAQEESPFWSFSRKSLLEEFERADWEQGFEIHDSGVILRGKITQQGYLYDTDMGFAIPQEGAKETYFAFAFSVELEE